MRIHRLVQPLTLATLLIAGFGTVHAQTMGLNWNPRTGDVWVDSQLADINRYGTSYRDPFIDEMVRYRGAPRDFVTDLLVNQRWSAGDVYYACTIAQAINRPCRHVADQWQANRGLGWGVVAQRLGIRPGSAEFQRLKQGFVPTYDRWARPIVLDADLKRAYPNHGKASGARGAAGHREGKVSGNAHAGKPHQGKAHAGAGSSSGKARGAAAGKDDHGDKRSQGGNSNPRGKAGGNDKGKGSGKGNGKN